MAYYRKRFVACDQLRRLTPNISPCDELTTTTTNPSGSLRNRTVIRMELQLLVP
jgi:hypothetical protein